MLPLPALKAVRKPSHCCLPQVQSGAPQSPKKWENVITRKHGQESSVTVAFLQALYLTGAGSRSLLFLLHQQGSFLKDCAGARAPEEEDPLARSLHKFLLVLARDPWLFSCCCCCRCPYPKQWCSDQLSSKEQQLRTSLQV